MSMDTTITVDHQPSDDAEAQRITVALRRLAERFEMWDADVNVRAARAHDPGRVHLASYGHKYQIDRLDTLARIVSRLIPGCNVRVEEEGLHEDYWGICATYRSGRKVRIGSREWVELAVHET